MFKQSRWLSWSGLELLAGFVWFSMSSALGVVASIPLWVIGGVFLSAGFSHLLWPGDLRPSKLVALGGVLGAVLSIPYGLSLGFVAFMSLFLSALTAAWGAGRISIQFEPHVAGVPVPEPTAMLAAKVAGDELILGLEHFQSSGFALDGTIERVIGEIDEMHSLFAGEGLIEKPETYHQPPPELLDPEIRQSEARGHRVEVLRFESGYAPPVQEPGRARWLGYAACRDGWAYVLRHPGPPRPWLICTNGYRMGHQNFDVGLFERFFTSKGLNILIPVLPLHGPRRLGWHSGTGFLGIDLVDTLHAESQAMWDMRRLLSWVKAQEAPSIGALGISLGGYTTSLFASVADGLDGVVAGIPLTDIARTVARHAEAHQFRYAEHLGFDLEKVRETLRVISPLAIKPKVAHENRFIFAGNADRLVTPDQVMDLWRHWDEPEIVWYTGSHLSFMNERDVWSGVDRTLRDAGIAIN